MLHGFAYVPHNELVTLVLSEFRSQLSHALTVNVWCGAISLPRQCLGLGISDVNLFSDDVQNAERVNFMSVVAASVS